MVKKTKRAKVVEPLFDPTKIYTTTEAVAVLQKCPPVRFDQSVDISIKLGVDPKKSDQNVRGTVSLPHGTGKKKVVLVLARGDKVKEALAAGADFAGSDELVEKIAGGWTDFDAVIATPDLMREVGKLGKVLGPRGLMPTPKAGTVTNDVVSAVREIQQGKIEFKSDKFGVVNCAIGKLSFSSTQITQNFSAVIAAIQRAKPSTVKGIYLKTGHLSSTMGPGLKVEIRESESAG
jgi:large subunit ribosomal protein L1